MLVIIYSKLLILAVRQKDTKSYRPPLAMTFASRSSTKGSSGASAWSAEWSSGSSTKASCFFSCRSRPLVSLWFLCDRMGEETGLRRVRGGNEAASREAAREAYLRTRRIDSITGPSTPAETSCLRNFAVVSLLLSLAEKSC